eukprot:6130061-Ditylum_brightwellii.AAC.1
MAPEQICGKDPTMYASYMLNHCAVCAFHRIGCAHGASSCMAGPPMKGNGTLLEDDRGSAWRNSNR